MANFFTGSEAQTKQLQRFTPQQQTGLDQILAQALSGLQTPQFDFAPIEQKARTGFAQKTIPSIAERFTAMGGQRSSAFPQQLSQAGAGLEESLAALGSQVGLQQQGMEQQKLLSLLGMGLSPRFETMFQPERQGFLGATAPHVGSAIAKMLPMILGTAIGGPAGGAMGAAGGSLLSRLFSGSR